MLSLRGQVGRLDSDKPAAIRLSGDNISEEHCAFENVDGKVTLHAMPDSVTVSAYLGALAGYRLASIVPEWKANHTGPGEDHDGI